MMSPLGQPCALGLLPPWLLSTAAELLRPHGQVTLHPNPASTSSSCSRPPHPLPTETTSNKHFSAQKHPSYSTGKKERPTTGDQLSPLRLHLASATGLPPHRRDKYLHWAQSLTPTPTPVPLFSQTTPHPHRRSLPAASSRSSAPMLLPAAIQSRPSFHGRMS